MSNLSPQMRVWALSLPGPFIFAFIVLGFTLYVVSFLLRWAWFIGPWTIQYFTDEQSKTLTQIENIANWPFMQETNRWNIHNENKNVKQNKPPA